MIGVGVCNITYFIPLGGTVNKIYGSTIGVWNKVLSRERAHHILEYFSCSLCHIVLVIGPKRDLVFQDQKVAPEVRNWCLLPRGYFSRLSYRTRNWSDRWIDLCIDWMIGWLSDGLMDLIWFDWFIHWICLIWLEWLIDWLNVHIIRISKFTVQA